MLAIGVFQWLLGLWSIPSAAGVKLVDINGVTISMSSTVKLVGTVVSLNSVDPHFGSVGVQLLHPNGNGPIVGETFFVDPSQLVVGS